MTKANANIPAERASPAINATPLPIATYWRPVVLVLVSFSVGYFISYFCRTINAVLRAAVPKLSGILKGGEISHREYCTMSMRESFRPARPDANKAAPEANGGIGIVELITSRDFDAVSWLAAVGTLIAASLVVAYPAISDAIWLAAQFP